MGWYRALRWTEKMTSGPIVHFEFGGDGESTRRSRLAYENGDTEQLKLTGVGADLYRLEESSFAGDAVYGDVIRARGTPGGALLFVKIVERSNLETQSWILSAEILATEEVQQILDVVTKAGGMWEQAFGGLLLIHTPASITKTIFDRISNFSSSRNG